MSDITISRFWDKFINKSIRYGLKPESVRWYVRHVEQYMQAHPELKLAQHNALTVETYLNNKGRNSAFKNPNFYVTGFSLDSRNIQHDRLTAC